MTDGREDADTGRDRGDENAPGVGSGELGGESGDDRDELTESEGSRDELTERRDVSSPYKYTNDPEKTTEERETEPREGTGMLRSESEKEWVDLEERRQEVGQPVDVGETLSKEELLEYITDRRSLSPLVQIRWGIRVTIGAIIVGLVAMFGLEVIGVDPRFGGAVVGVLVLLGLLWVFLYYRLWVYQIQEDAIYLERGVVTHVRSLVPYVRIQHVDTSRSPLERMLGLSTLVVYTAGSRGADVSIPGLQPDEARDLQKRVKELAIEAEGDDAL